MRSFSSFLKKTPFPRSPWLLGAVLLVIVGCIVTLFFVFTGKTRRQTEGQPSIPDQTSATTTASTLQQRHLDGVMVPLGEEKLRPRAVMVDNQVDARPLFGLADANVAIESPVEGGITRFLLVFDPKTPLEKVGPVRSARPYFVEWAQGWQAGYFHVGGSPDALDKIRTIPSSSLVDVNEMAKGWAFWRDANRVAPHQVMTNQERMNSILQSAPSSTGWIGVWHFTPSNATSTVGDIHSIRIPYGGSYSVRWTYDPATHQYQRSNAGRAVASTDRPILANNVVVLKTDATILDDKGRLRIRTTGGGEAVLYRDGSKFSMRWRRSTNEVLSFVGTDGEDILLNPGKTWIQVTTDDQVFAGLGQ